MRGWACWACRVRREGIFWRYEALLASVQVFHLCGCDDRRQHALPCACESGRGIVLLVLKLTSNVCLILYNWYMNYLFVGISYWMLQVVQVSQLWCLRCGMGVDRNPESQGMVFVLVLDWSPSSSNA